MCCTQCLCSSLTSLVPRPFFLQLNAGSRKKRGGPGIEASVDSDLPSPPEWFSSLLIVDGPSGQYAEEIP